MEYGCNTRIMTLERFLDKVPDEIPELHFAIPARTHPTYPHVRSKTANGENDVDRSERSKQDEVEEDDVAEDEVDDDDVEDDDVEKEEDNDVEDEHVEEEDEKDDN